GPAGPLCFVPRLGFRPSAPASARNPSSARRLPPEADSAREAVDVGEEADVGGELDAQVLDVAAAEMQHVVIEDRRELIEHFPDALAPFLFAQPLELGVADALLVRLSLLEWVMAELEVRHEVAIDEQGGAEAGPERQHELDPAPVDDAVALQIGVVDDAHGDARDPTKIAFEIVLLPRSSIEVRRGVHDAMNHDAGEAHRNAIERRLLREHLLDDFDDGARRRGPRGQKSQTLVDGASLRVEHEHFD